MRVAPHSVRLGSLRFDRRADVWPPLPAVTWCMTNPHEADSMGYTKLMKAAYRSDEQAVRYLVEQRVAVNAVASDGHSALSIAVRAGHASIVAILLDGGADSSFRDHGMTLLDVAKSFGYADIERILKEKHQRCTSPPWSSTRLTRCSATYSRATAPAAGMSVTIPTSVPAGTGTVRRLRMVGTSRSQLLVDTFAGGATNNAKADTSLIDQMASLDDFVIFGNSAEQQKASAAAITDEEVNRLLQTIPDRPSESRGHKEKVCNVLYGCLLANRGRCSRCRLGRAWSMARARLGTRRPRAPRRRGRRAWRTTSTRCCSPSRCTWKTIAKSSMRSRIRRWTRAS